MNDNDEIEINGTAGEEDESVLDIESTEPVANAKGRRRKLRGRDRTAIAALVALLLVGGTIAFIWWWRSRESGAGRPVPAPRGPVVTGQPNGTSQTMAEPDATLTISPEVIARSGIKIEMVGEQLTTDIASGATSTGVVQANEYRSTPVVSLVGGILRSVKAELGQNVRRGQTLGVVSSDELAMVQSRYLVVLADLEEHHLHHTRVIRLVEIGAASREELEQATTKLKTAESEVASLREQLLILGLTSQRVAALRTPSQVSSQFSLSSPVSGTIITRSANSGEVIEKNKEILRVADLSSVWIIGQLYEKDLASIRVGSGATITSNAYPERVFRGQVSYVDPTLDPTTRTAQIRIELANPGQVLKIGMYVNIAFAVTGNSEATTPSVPKVAVQNLGSRKVVFVTTAEPNVFVMRTVHVGLESNGRYPVLEGLSVGERIVTEGSLMLRAEWLKLNPGGSTQTSGGAASMQHQH